jgi:RNA polymerase sigma-70 factor (ECF subfamily)
VNSSESDLLAEAQRFDEEALAAIYERYSPRLYGYALRLLGDENLAEECVAETFLRLLKALQAGQGPHDFLQAYLYRVAHNWISDLYRRQPPPPLELDERWLGSRDSSPDAQTEQHQLQQEMRSALLRLSPDQRQVVMLRFFEGLSIEEVAAALSKPAGAVKSLQHRGLAALNRILVRSEAETVYDTGS